jgi:hypothetical protein
MTWTNRLPPSASRHLQRARFPAWAGRALLVLGVLTTFASVAAGPLLPYPLHRIGDGPGVVAAADLDDDGWLDLISTHWDLEEVHVVMGTGDGAFSSPDEYAAGDDVWGLAVGDFDEDGAEDFAAALAHEHEISIRFGNGDGTFGPETRLPSCGFPEKIVIGDVDDDGHQDLIVGCVSDGRLFRGAGDGTFSSSSIGGGRRWIAAGDFNGDGNDDVAFSEHSLESVDVRLSIGDGSFTPGGVFWVGENPRHIAVGDADNDGDLDLAVVRPGPDASYLGEVTLLFGAGGGTFGDPRSFGVGYFPDQAAIADLDRDGLADLVVANSHTNSDDIEDGAALSVFLGTGEGQFADVIEIDRVRYHARSLVLGDFDHDGILDLVKADNWSDEVGVLFGRGDGTFVAPLHDRVGDDPQVVVVGDLDHDGRLDLVTVNQGSNDLSILLADGAASFAPEMRQAAGAGPAWVAIGELTGDAHPDLAVADSVSHEVAVLRGNGDGTFDTAHTVPLLDHGPSSPSCVVVGDFNLDGRGDLAVAARGADRVAVLLGLGEHGFQPPAYYSVDEEPTSLVVEDFNGDEIPDLAVSCLSGKFVRSFTGDGDGTFTLRDIEPTVWYPTQLAAGDWSGDGSMDLVVIKSIGLTTGLHLLRGDGDGKFTTHFGNIPFPGDTVALDLDGNGWLEAVGGENVPVRHITSTQSVTAEQLHAGRAEFVATGDFDLDGRPDVVLAKSGLWSDDVAILLNQTGPKVFTFESDGETLVWPSVTGALSYDIYRGNLAELVDSNGDGLPDAGYGVCRTGSDNDPHDTAFVDAEEPAPDAGFFYLRSVVDAAGDGGVGSTSSGLARLPSVPCP